MNSMVLPRPSVQQQSWQEYYESTRNTCYLFTLVFPSGQKALIEVLEAPNPFVAVVTALSAIKSGHYHLECGNTAQGEEFCTYRWRYTPEQKKIV